MKKNLKEEMFILEVVGFFNEKATHVDSVENNISDITKSFNVVYAIGGIPEQ